MGVYQDEHYKDSIKLEARTPLLLIQSTGSQKCGKGEGWGPGERDHFLLHYVVSGEGEYHCGNDTWHLHGGDAFMIYPHTHVEYRASRLEPWEYLWVGFNGFDAPGCVEEIGFTQQQPVLRSRGSAGIRTRMEALYRSYGLSYADRLTMAAKLYELAAFLVRTADTRREQQEQRQRVAGRGIYHAALPRADQHRRSRGLCFRQPEQPLPPLCRALSQIPEALSAGIPH